MKKGKSFLSLFLVIAVTVLFGVSCMYGVDLKGTGAAKNINLGLDLEGGVSITYQVKGDNPSQKDMDDTVYKLQKRVEQYSTEAQAYQVGDNRISIEIPGVNDANAILEELGQPGSLYFIKHKNSAGEENYTLGSSGYVLNKTIDELKESDSIVLTGSEVKTASAGQISDSTTGSKEYGVDLELTTEGAEKFKEATQEAVNNSNDTIAIYYDGELISVPKVNTVIENGKAQIVPITRIAHVRLDDLVGYEIPKQKLIENTEAFVRGRKANNCLLFGDAGTGKSSSIKGILNQYYDEGLRIIEAYKHQFQDLNEIIAQIKDRNYKFIIYMDDLSFEEFEIEYKYLKAVIEGGLERKPDNILIYATSNRRHLVRERAGDKLEVGDSDDIHSSDTVQEKLSLVYRFGVRIYFGAPDRKEFHTIVKTLAARHGIQMPEDQLLAEAGKWEISHGGLTGRTAQQFIDHLLGKEEN